MGFAAVWRPEVGFKFELEMSWLVFALFKWWLGRDYKGKIGGHTEECLGPSVS